MIKRLLVLCLIFFSVYNLDAQPYGNEWINFTQKYYKIKITQNGVYRVPYTVLSNAGIPINSIDPRNIQIFNKGKEQAIYISGESDGVFNTNDYIEFYAEKNDGSLDSALYTYAKFVPNPYYSLINDTAVYFLTWNNSTNNKRLTLETDSNFSGYTPENYFLKEEIKDIHDKYYFGETNDVAGTDSRYTRSEGWFDANEIDIGNSKAYSINTNNLYASGPNTLIKSVALGASKNKYELDLGNDDHRLKIEFKGSSGNYQQLVDTTFKGYEANKFAFSITSSLLGNTTTDFNYSSIPINSVSSNRTVVSYIYVKYPHTFDLEGANNFTLFVPHNSSQSKMLLNISNFNTSGIALFYDLSNNKRIDVVTTGNTNHSLLLPTSGSEIKCFITSDNAITTIASISPINTSAQFTDFNALAVDSAFVIITHPSLMGSQITGAIKYKDYRSSNTWGGLHNVIIADINELYDQFAYGIVKSPLSIRHFADYMLDKYPTPPQNLFLFGKSIHMRLCRQSTTNYSNCLVPSFGNPSSDNLFTSELNSNNIAPAIPTGRLAAKTLSQADLYLNKVEQYENRTTNPPDKWMKHILHFGGGQDIGEQATFKNYLNVYKGIIEDSLYGGKVVKEFFKTSSAPIQINVSDTLEDLINEGVSLMTFFGHASGTGFDQSIDDVNTYNPLSGHYPFLLANSCYAGDFHSTGISSSETFMLVPNKGMIGYLGSVGLGVPYALNIFSKEFYTQIALTSYNKSVGNCIRNTITLIGPNALSDTLLKATCYEMNLHGDPALKLNTHDLPDYKITSNDIFFDITKTDSFIVYAVRRNVGRAINDSIFTELTRIFPNGDVESFLHRGKAPIYADTIPFKLPVDFGRGIRLNKIKISLDISSELAESNEFNNTDSANLLITGGDIMPVYPYEFAIIPADTVTLKASTADPLAKAKDYIFQIDTVDTFNSGFKQTIKKNSTGGVITWKPLLLPNDSMVYYWRVSPDSIDTTGYKWRESSFQYINNKRGWSQAHFFQYKNDGYEYVKFNRPQRKFDFVNDIQQISCTNGMPNYFNYSDICYKINGQPQNSSSFADPGIIFSVFDPISGKPWQNSPQGNNLGLYGSIFARPVGWPPKNAFDFRQSNTADEDTITKFINKIPTGYHVLAYTYSYHNAPNYGVNLRNAFKSLGSTQIDNVPAARVYIFWGRKGNTNLSKEVIGTSVSSIEKLDTSITTNWNVGHIASPVIGPALSWGSLHWRSHSLETGNTKDTIYLRVIGIKANGTEDMLVHFPKDSMDVLSLSSYVDVNTYPYIRLVAFMRDDSLKTPPQIERWQVIYSPVPEAALNPPVGYAINKDTLEEGEDLSIVLPIQNISEYNFNDSLLVTYWIQDANNVKKVLPNKLKKSPFVPSQIIFDSLKINTVGFPGKNYLWVEANPVNQPKSQLEQYHFNNIIRIPFTVSNDKINPLLDVTFDGIHILNNDIVSAKPNILIQLKDENKFLALNDTTDFKVFIKKPNSSVEQRIYFHPDTMTFIPAELPNNSCKINYTPKFPIDGTYQLIIQAQDKSDNTPGTGELGPIDYKINFKIENKIAITEVMNYPNPFSTSTRFVFTLTGYKVPTDFKIQIMTITGKVVREIFLDELGPIHVGRNITDYAWDGKDQFGDQLANGVYLYRVITRMDGEDIEKIQTEADQYFKKGWGKMYLMR